MAPLQRQTILSRRRHKKGNRGEPHRPYNFAAPPPQSIDISITVAQLLASTSSMARNRANLRYYCGNLPMKHSPSGHSPSQSCVDCRSGITRLPRNAGRAIIWIYRHTLSPLVGYNCRHLPTCSVYGDEAIARFGLWGGGWMTLARVLRCHPWGTSGIDNVPLTKPVGAQWYRPWRFGRWRGVNGP
jgi:putative membrane protein insertion efficiency factor